MFDKKILILSFANHKTAPRVYRQIKALEESYDIMNTPFKSKLEPSPVKADKIHLIHHGISARGRSIESMIELVSKYLDERFELTLMLVKTDPGYYESLKKLANPYPRIHFVDPVPMPEIAQRINQYDIGFCMLEPDCFNHKFALPNKFFEFIQGCLGIAVWPLPEMSRIVRQEGNGIVAEEHTLSSIASCLNGLDAEIIKRFKEKSHEVTDKYCSDNFQHDLMAMTNGLLA